MQRTEIARIFADMEQYGGQEVTVCGWVRTVRDLKNFGFIELNDGSCFKSLQVVFERETLENYDQIAKQNVGAALIVHGTLILTPDAKQPFELKADSIQVEGAFGLIKNDFGFRRFLTTGKKNVRIELLFLALAFNLKKRWMKQQKRRLETHYSEKKVA